MTVLVDTPIWSLAYRRRRLSDTQSRIVDELKKLVRNHNAVMVGPVRQEILSGMHQPQQYELLRATLQAFEDLSLIGEDWERAARYSNICRGQGVQGSPTDFLLCAVAQRFKVAIFTTDKDFVQYAHLLSISLHQSPGS